MLLVDTADRHAIARWTRFPGVTGFTTNPNLMARAAGVESMKSNDYRAAALGLCRLSNDIEPVAHVMVQGFGQPEQIVDQADAYLQALRPSAGKQLWVKLAPTREAVSCCAALHELGCKTLVTAVFTAAQALVAMKAGADGVAVYIGRMRKVNDRWDAQMGIIADVVGAAGGTVLLASFPDLETVELGLSYSQDLTVPPQVLEAMLSSDLSASALEDFNARIAA
ncbi:MAG: transaldolase family protein [Sphingomonadales bacterium]